MAPPVFRDRRFKMSPLQHEIRRLFEAGHRYLDGCSSVHELNGLASSCRQLARSEGVESSVANVLLEWQTMVNRRWNEWGSERNPISEDEFKDWLREQLPFSK